MNGNRIRDATFNAEDGNDDAPARRPMPTPTHELFPAMRRRCDHFRADTIHTENDPDAAGDSYAIPPQESYSSSSLDHRHDGDDGGDDGGARRDINSGARRWRGNGGDGGGSDDISS